MVTCAAAGVRPAEFRRLTLAEIAVILEGDARRRKTDLIDRIVAAVRALGQAFSGKNALEGIADEQMPVPIGIEAARRLRFWRPSDGD